MHHLCTMHHKPKLKSMNEILSIRGAARRLNKSHSTISRYVQAHPELNRGTAERPMVNAEELRQHRLENLNPSRIRSHAGRLLGESSDAGKGNKNGAGPNYAMAKAVRETVLAERAQIDLDEKRGLLVPIAEIQAAVFEAGMLLQRDLLELGPQLAERLASMDDPKAIAALIETELRRVLAALAASLRGNAEADEVAKTAATGEVIPIDERRP